MRPLTALAALAAVLAGSSVIFLEGCNKGSPSLSSAAQTQSGQESDSAIAVGVASGTAALGSGQNVGLMRVKTPAERLEELLSPIPTAFAAGASACPTYPSGATCSGQSMTLTYDDCSFGGSTATWTGGQLLTFGGTAICGTTNLPIVNSNDTLTRAFVGTLATTPTKRMAANGTVVSLDTATLSGYAVGASGGMVISGNGTGHTIVINGIHLVSPLWDHTVTTTASAPLTVTNPGANRVISSGTIVIQHNTALYTGQTVFNNVGYNGTSCYPQSGSVTTTFSGSLIGTETLTFNGGGSATLTNSKGVTTTFTMVHCF